MEILVFACCASAAPRPNVAITAPSAASIRFIVSLLLGFLMATHREYPMGPRAVASRIEPVRTRSSNRTRHGGTNQMAQVIGVPKETFPGEKRVATVPEVVPKLA